MDVSQIITVPNVIFTIIVAEKVFTIFNYFKNPQIQNDKNDLLLSASVTSLKETVQHIKDNDLHTIQKTLEMHENTMKLLAIEAAKLQTIIDERIPKKTN
jgi:hypothetical protein